jgi:hypothetical protein
MATENGNTGSGSSMPHLPSQDTPNGLDYEQLAIFQ